MNEELIAKAREAKSAEELLTIAKENHYPLTEEEAQNYFNQFHATGELSDDELDQVGGGCGGGQEEEPLPEGYWTWDEILSQGCSAFYAHTTYQDKRFSFYYYECPEKCFYCMHLGSDTPGYINSNGIFHCKKGNAPKNR